MTTKLVKERSKKAGLPPGSLIHIGEKHTEPVKISVTTFSETEFEEKEYDQIDGCIPLKEKPSVTWINVEGVHNPQVIEKLGTCFGLHPLLMEDVLNTDQRPKVEFYENRLFVVLRMIYPSPRKNGLINEQVSVILGENFVLSLQEGKEGDVFDPIRDQIRANRGRIRKSGADYLAYALIDAVVDSYFAILEHLGGEIEAMEETVLKNPSPRTLQILHRLRQEMIYLRKSLWPLRELINRLEHDESPLISHATMLYFRDIYDHVVQEIDTVETYRDMLTGMMDIYLSSVSNRINEVMKVLTIIATIFIPLTFLAGVYGMNFQYFPEVHWRWGYLVFWLICLSATIGMLIFFRRKKWI